MTNSKTKSAQPRPVHTVRYGSIKAAVWRNIVDSGNSSRAMYNVSVSRSYKDGDEWKDSSSFGYDDLLLLAKAVKECHSFIHLHLQKPTATSLE
jgi:hypothetical protein